MLMEINAAADISLRSSFEIISATTGGVENVGCTKVDHRNHLARIRQRQMIRGEATAIAEYFRDKSRLCPEFWYEVEVDAEENIANIFWADQRMRDDYACFSDSITFDTTYKMNKHYRPLGNVLHYHIKTPLPTVFHFFGQALLLLPNVDIIVSMLITMRLFLYCICTLLVLFYVFWFIIVVLIFVANHFPPSALFVGFNNHHQGVVFGAALLYGETIPSFVWLFNAFLRCMHNKAPDTIFTDQDPEMENAIQQALPKTYHALCTFIS
ncbi:Protein FAR1-RELATED SEQUENCE 5 [Linum grandiflorum]